LEGKVISGGFGFNRGVGQLSARGIQEEFIFSKERTFGKQPIPQLGREVTNSHIEKIHLHGTRVLNSYNEHHGRIKVRSN